MKNKMLGKKIKVVNIVKQEEEKINQQKKERENQKSLENIGVKQKDINLYNINILLYYIMNQTLSKLLYNAREEQKKLVNIHVLLEDLEENNDMNKTIDFRNNSDSINDEEVIEFNEIPPVDHNTNGELVESTIKDLFKHQTAKGGTETAPIKGSVKVTKLEIVKPSEELVIAKLKQKEIKHDPETMQKTIDKVESEIKNNLDDFTTEIQLYINTLNDDIIEKDHEIWNNLDNKEEENRRKWEQELNEWINEQNKDILEIEGELLKYYDNEVQELSEEIPLMGGKKTRRRKSNKRKTKRKLKRSKK